MGWRSSTWGGVGRGGGHMLKGGGKATTASIHPFYFLISLYYNIFIMSVFWGDVLSLTGLCKSWQK